jgi:hypothetical protein
MPGHFPNMLRTAFDFALYGEVIRQRARRTVGYFALLVVVLSFVLTVANMFHLRAFIKKEVLPELSKLPVVTIKGGVASANVPQPWIKSFRDEGSGWNTIVVVDTTGEVKGFRGDEQGLILQRTKLLVRSQSNPQIQTIDLQDLDDTVIDAMWLRHWLDVGVWICGAAMLLARPVYHAGAKLLWALILSLLAMLVAASTGKRVSYGQLFTIALYALTPAILLDTVFDVVNVNVPHFWVLFFLVAAAYTGLAVYKLPAASDPALPSQPPSPPANSPPMF